MSERRLSGRSALLLLAALICAGCGFHLQQALTLPPQMARTHVRAIDTHSLFYRELLRELEKSGTEIVQSPEDASAVIDILLDETDQRVLSVSARNTPTEYEVYYSVRYGISHEDEVLVPVSDVTLTRDYTYDPTLVLGKEREEQVLRERIVRDLVRIVLEQASAR